MLEKILHPAILYYCNAISILGGSGSCIKTRICISVLKARYLAWVIISAVEVYRPIKRIVCRCRTLYIIYKG